METDEIPIDSIHSDEPPTIFETTEFHEEFTLKSFDLITESSEIIETENTEEPSKSMSASDETKHVKTINSGTCFRLMMTVVEKWSDEYLNRNSEKFKTLASGLGMELIDLIDNSKESTEPNMTTFKLVEVVPSKDSPDKIYVTFIVTSKNEISGEDLSIAVSTQISLYQSIYEYSATSDGFVVENISEEIAESYDVENIACNSGERFHFALNATSKESLEQPREMHEPVENLEFHSNLQCKQEKIERGSTSIYIFDSQQNCADSVRRKFSENNLKELNDGEYEDDMMADEAEKEDKNKNFDCEKNFKSSIDEKNFADETVIVIRKRGNKVFVEL
ncbi:CLUMA_CG020710, isoform A [Clunio marinus]|uniref:CLUMA_CG020710, isoform A n=1 Tax=Clunio marinus TaxID=568069 RepID=A0A1J1J7K5_9DIPT|nr:CLUMA_CG020710, isoform A [Clunio marinus]